ncbi:MAG TPA: alpha/beta hydrolase [Candidatus Sulfotelmatobacter sp.]|nr:alpha/beta hydrolase [Candidatus Sulfotelmatobacter sp.]
MSKAFVLIHGSWHGGWAWQEVVRHLSKTGHRAEAPTLPGHGPGAMRVGITHQDCVRAVVDFIHQHRLENVVLVGHSFGGSVVQRVVEEVPKRIERTVFLDALIIEDGHCVFDELPADYVAMFNQLAGTSSDDTMLIPWEIWREKFIQDAREPVARSLWEQLSPEPNQVNLDKLCLKQFYSLDIPKSFIHCRHDRALPPGYFHPRMSSRLGAFTLIEMEGSHEVMFTRPEELANKIVEASLG